MTTVAELLFAEDRDRSNILKHATVLTGAASVQLRVPQLPHAVSDAIRHAFALDIPDVVWDALEKEREVLDACERTKHDPAARESDVSIGERTVTADLHTTVTVTDDRGVPLFSFPVRITLSLQLDIITLKVLGGRVVAVGSGKATCTAALCMNEVAVLATQPRTIQLPELVDLTQRNGNALRTAQRAPLRG